MQPDKIVFRADGNEVALASLLSAAHELAPRLREHTQVLNLCADRSRFSVALLAALLAGRGTLLPPNRQPGTLRQFLTQFPGSALAYDDAPPAVQTGGLLQVPAPSGARPHALAAPDIDADFDCVTLFTSGSTGQPKANGKPWRTLAEGTRHNAARVLDGLDGRVSVVATVPPNHMYGLETSILFPLLHDVVAFSGRPLYPADVAAALAAQARPRMLITTPVHLRALLAAPMALPPADRLLCATAPLPVELAARAEEAFETQLMEIYGCTETGCLATRHTTRESTWRLLEPFALDVEGGAVVARAAHLPGPVELQDDLQLLDDGRFELAGRGTDLINVGGKRGSLGDLTRQLLALRGVSDGVVFVPQPQPGRSVERLAGLVVSERPVREILAELAEGVDPALLPRPLLRTARLPRGETGKIDRRELLELYAAALRGHRP